MLRRKGVIGIIRILNGNADNTVRNTVVQVTHVHPVLVIVIAAATYTVTVISNNFLASHGGTGLGPCQQVVVVAANTALVTLGTTTRREKVIDLTLVKIGIPANDVTIQPRGNIHRNLGIGQVLLDGRHNLVKPGAAKFGVGNATPLLGIRGTSIPRSGILEKVRFNQPDGGF